MLHAEGAGAFPSSTGPGGYSGLLLRRSYPRQVRVASPLLAPVLTLVIAGSACTSAAESDGATGGASPPERAVHAAIVQLDPAGFAAVIAEPTTFVVNVHVPDEGSIPGTDAAIPYDRISDRSATLPADRAAPLAIYCKSGRMSALAAATLVELGYTDVVELRGGMDAWRADDRALLPPAT